VPRKLRSFSKLPRVTGSLGARGGLRRSTSWRAIPCVPYHVGMSGSAPPKSSRRATVRQVSQDQAGATGRGARSLDCTDDVARVVADEDYSFRLDRYVGSGADCDADIGVASAGASLTPSPTITTLRPPVWKRLTAAALSSERTCAATSSMLRRLATESATAYASPVIIATLIPIAWSRLIASADSGRISSSTASAPITLPPATTCRTVRPSLAHASVAGSAFSPRSASRRGPPTGTSRPLTFASWRSASTHPSCGVVLDWALRWSWPDIPY
jgi:hypothetical protein